LKILCAFTAFFAPAGRKAADAFALFYRQRKNLAPKKKSSGQRSLKIRTAFFRLLARLNETGNLWEKA